MAYETYVELHKKYPELENIKESEENSFIILTKEGKIAYERLVFLIEKNLKIVDCFMLKMILHLFLWFFTEHDTYYIIFILYNQDKIKNSDFKEYFVVGIENLRKIEEFITKKLIKKGGNSDVLTEVVEEMIDKMMIGFISPIYYPYLLINFVVEGYQAIVKIILALLYMTDYRKIDNAKELKNQINFSFHYLKFIKLYASIEVDDIYFQEI